MIFCCSEKSLLSTEGLMRACNLTDTRRLMDLRVVMWCVCESVSVCVCEWVCVSERVWECVSVCVSECVCVCVCVRVGARA